jgi:hypothetical protein
VAVLALPTRSPSTATWSSPRHQCVPACRTDRWYGFLKMQMRRALDPRLVTVSRVRPAFDIVAQMDVPAIDCTSFGGRRPQDLPTTPRDRVPGRLMTTTTLTCR